MNKFYASALYIFLFSLQPAVVSAQNFNAFATAGIVASQVSSDELGGFDKAGFTFGGGVVTPISKKMSLAFEINFIQKGSRKPNKLDQGDPTQYLMRLNYLEVPLMLGYTINDNFTAYLGLSAAYLVSSLEENENGTIALALPFNSTDFSGVAGVGYYLTENLRADLRGTQSIIPFRDFGGDRYGFMPGGNYHSVMELTVSWYFKKEKQ